MSDRRPRVPEDAFTTVEELASEQGKTTSEMLVEMIRAYNDAEYANGVLSENNRLLKEIHGSLTIQPGGSRGNAVKKSESASASTSLDIDYNALSVGHDVAIPRDSEDWEQLWSENIIKHRPQYLIPVVQGLINDTYDTDAALMDLPTLRKVFLGEFGLSENTIDKYVSEYGPEYDAWYIGYGAHKDFSKARVRSAALERMADKKPESTAALENYREKYPSFESLYKKDLFSVNSKSYMPEFVNGISTVTVGNKKGLTIPKLDDLAVFDKEDNSWLLLGMLEAAVDAAEDTGGVLRVRMQVLAEYMLLHLAEHQERLAAGTAALIQGEADRVSEWASDEYMEEIEFFLG